MSTVRMPHPATLVPEAMTALLDLSDAISGTGVNRGLLALIHLRASQINGCAASVAGAAGQARRHGVSADRLDALAAWREAPSFSDAERAALALTESVTRLADSPDAVPDRVWDVAATYFDQKELAALLLSIAVANAVNRLDAPTRQQAGDRRGWSGGPFAVG
ncbi:carboxymuconolactone decarboxylase family protein [Phytomonospora endophytica]|uniref:AhpD family alkylhydroperoxidase n=1 Tax=Phytomonospora endophytica TaxID=714109 RepID=A0A841FGI3_9ACTN|nr:carboxymuconolactone decarboxylase family protein [Phytomonospora endophytica]MBB6032662.1 AhpD family alkylhydroperoxidase [Phytomonospora endophytica]GIG66188.1 alkyl hydroperoxide reductase AhpD [Phytomonospora endophytica]